MSGTADPRKVSAASLARGYERSDVNVRWAIVVGIGFFLVLAASIAGVALMASSFRPAAGDRPDVPALERTNLTPPPPRLEVNPTETLQQVRQRETRMLTGYGWVDRKAGIARIPIDEAMRALAASGWPRPDRTQPGTAP